VPNSRESEIDAKISSVVRGRAFGVVRPSIFFRNLNRSSKREDMRERARLLSVCVCVCVCAAGRLVSHYPTKPPNHWAFVNSITSKTRALRTPKERRRGRSGGRERSSIGSAGVGPRAAAPAPRKRSSGSSRSTVCRPTPPSPPTPRSSKTPTGRSSWMIRRHRGRLRRRRRRGGLARTCVKQGKANVPCECVCVCVWNPMLLNYCQKQMHVKKINQGMDKKSHGLQK
jgi:hypothetical protein